MACSHHKHLDDMLWVQTSQTLPEVYCSMDEAPDSTGCGLSLRETGTIMDYNLYKEKQKK